MPVSEYPALPIPVFGGCSLFGTHAPFLTCGPERSNGASLFRWRLILKNPLLRTL